MNKLRLPKLVSFSARRQSTLAVTDLLTIDNQEVSFDQIRRLFPPQDDWESPGEGFAWGVISPDCYYTGLAICMVAYSPLVAWRFHDLFSLHYLNGLDRHFIELDSLTLDLAAVNDMLLSRYRFYQVTATVSMSITPRSIGEAEVELSLVPVARRDVTDIDPDPRATDALEATLYDYFTHCHLPAAGINAKAIRIEVIDKQELT